MARVVVVHGINNQFGARQLMADSWASALLGGVELAGYRGWLEPGDVGGVFYGDVFRRPGRTLGGDDLGWLSSEDVESGVEAELVASWWAEAAETDPGVVAPGRRTLGVADGVQAALAALAGSRYLAGAAENVLIAWLWQVRAYFRRPGVRELAAERFAEQIGPDTEVVVAHSLGSVVAYEVLCAHPEWSVRRLVTLGSPLGIQNVVLDRLRPAPTRSAQGARGEWPQGLREWVNIADRMDFVALVKKLGPVFDERIVDVRVDNGVRVHDVMRYLTARETGQAIVDPSGLHGSRAV